MSSGISQSMWILFAIGVLITLVIYFVPTMIAFSRHHSKRIPILVLNILLGWTFIGWIGALVWSLTEDNNNSSSII